jgi:hypothetical protein
VGVGSGDWLGFIGLPSLDSHICDTAALFEQVASGECIFRCEARAEVFDRQINDLWKPRVFAFDEYF